MEGQRDGVGCQEPGARVPAEEIPAQGVFPPREGLEVRNEGVGLRQRPNAGLCPERCDIVAN